MHHSILQRLTQEITSFYDQPSAVVPDVSAEQIRAHLSHYDFVNPKDSEQLFDDVCQMLRHWNIQISHPRYFGLFNPAPTMAAIVAEGLAAVYNPQMAAWSHAPASNEIERHTLHFVAQQLGFDTQSLACNFTAGGSEANHSAVVVALAHHYPQSLDQGLRALAKQPLIYVSELAHNSFDKIVKHVGLGLNALRSIPTDASLRLDVRLLQQQIEQDQAAGYEPFMIAATAGVTSTGTIDPLNQLADVAQALGLWYHVDGAWAGAGVFSEQLKPYLQGIERADSVTVDAHKWFNLTMGAGMFFTRHPQANAAAFKVRADYMPASQPDVTVPYLSTMQWSRRFIGLKMFMTLAEAGQGGVARIIEQQVALGAYFRRRMTQHGWTIINDTPLPVVNFTHPRFESGQLHVDECLNTLYQAQEVWLSSVTLKGQKVFRMCISNFKTTETDVDFLVETLNRYLD